MSTLVFIAWGAGENGVGKFAAQELCRSIPFWFGNIQSEFQEEDTKLGPKYTITVQLVNPEKELFLRNHMRRGNFS